MQHSLVDILQGQWACYISCSETELVPVLYTRTVRNGSTAANLKGCRNIVSTVVNQTNVNLTERTFINTTGQR